MFHGIIKYQTRKNVSIKKAEYSTFFIVCCYVNDWNVRFIQKYDVLTGMFSNIQELKFFSRHNTAIIQFDALKACKRRCLIFKHPPPPA